MRPGRIPFRAVKANRFASEFCSPTISHASDRDRLDLIISVGTQGGVITEQGAKTDINVNYDFRNRVYSPTLGRWLTNDPLGFEAGVVNTFRYVGNGPGNGLDPMGLEMPVPSKVYNPPASKITPKFPKYKGQMGIRLKNNELPFLNQAITYFFETSKFNRLREAIEDGNVIDPAFEIVKNKNGIMAGKHAFFNGFPETGLHFGKGGANPCVGVINVSRDNRKVCGGVFHLYPGADRAGTIRQYKWNEITTAYVFEINNNDNLSYYQYRNICRFLKKQTNERKW